MEEELEELDELVEEEGEEEEEEEEEEEIGKQKGAYLFATLSRPPTNLPVSRAAALDQHKNRHLHALRAVSSAHKQQFGKQAEQQQAYCAAARVCPTSSKSLKSRGLRWSREGLLW